MCLSICIYLLSNDITCSAQNESDTLRMNLHAYPNKILICNLFAVAHTFAFVFLIFFLKGLEYNII